ncbi:MAG: glycoside hydrolase family 43 protein [Lacrimispora sp.]|uniref:glycoside hydrolase family 43 protein n=1 Tax=Lacrimispora sp. TaxID=2719234 RepID=UPI0039E5F76C
MIVKNPVLKGFHPDPSIIRVEDDYYIATSTFEWWPGVSIHHSRDLVHWELLTYPLSRISQLDLRGVGPSQGIWAPCLTYHHGIYYLVYTVVRSFYCNMYDTNNFMVMADNILGPWSEPIALNNFGFDPSLFHDDDGRKYMVSMVTDHRVPKKYAGRLVLQEYSSEKKCMIGQPREIYAAKDIFLEGPHILKRNGYYYLLSADTGTGEGHGETIQRSSSIWGPYEMYRPKNIHRTSDTEAFSILTTRHHPDYPIQKAGHCDLVEAKDGSWYCVYLMGRPLKQRNPDDALRFPGCRRYPLGRETAIARMEWTPDGWLQLANGTNLPDLETEISGHEPHLFLSKPVRDDFDSEILDLEFQSLRIPLDESFLSLNVRPGYLRLFGREGLASLFAQSLIARRWTSFHFRAAAKVAFEPTVFKQMAGLICMYDHENYLYLHITHDEDIGRCISVLKAENKNYSYPVGFIAIEDGEVQLEVEVHEEKLQFYYKTEKRNKQKIGTSMDCSFMSDEACNQGWFTGAMVGMCCQDLTGSRLYADFDWFDYENLMCSSFEKI